MLEYAEIISQQSEVKLIQLDYIIETIGNNAKVKVTHVIKNESNTDCCVNVSLNLDDESAVVGYSFKNNNGEFVSQLKEKEQAKTEQKEATANGYSTGLMEKKTDNAFTVSLGLVLKGTEVSFTIEYLTRMDIDGEKMMVSIPSHPSNGNRKIPMSVTMDGTSKFRWKGKMDSEMEFEVDLHEEMMIMRDEDTDEVALSSTFINKEKEGDVRVIFVCDRSGSMSGEGITNLREMLQLFLRQLPINSQFNIVSFGDQFTFMFPEMMKYSEEIMNKASEEVNWFQANYGGTEMSRPLQKMINDKLENTHIILLTDGEDWSKNKVISCVKELAKKNIIHGVGLGSSCDMTLMRDCGRMGSGISVHARDPSTLRREVSNITQRILIPSYTNCSMKWNIEGEMIPKEVSIFGGVMTCYLKVNDEGGQLKEEQMIACELKGTCKGESRELKKEIEYTKEKEMNNILLLHQLIAHQQIRKLEGEGNLAEAKRLSLKYNVLCKETAFIAIDKTTRNEVDLLRNVELMEDRRYNDSIFSFGCFGMSNSYVNIPIGAAPTCRAAPTFGATSTWEAEKKCRAAPVIAAAPTWETTPTCGAAMNVFAPPTPGSAMNVCALPTQQMNVFSPPPQQMNVCALPTPGSAMNVFSPPPLGSAMDVFSPPPLGSAMDVFSPPPPGMGGMFEAPRQPMQQNIGKQLPLTKQQMFDRIIYAQKATGQFVDVDMFIDQLQSFKYRNVDKIVVHTFFIILLLKEQFKEFKTQWNLLVKKAQQWLDAQPTKVSTEMESELMAIVHSITF